MKYVSIIIPLFFILFSSVYGEKLKPMSNDNVIRVLTWNGYVTKEDIKEVNQILSKQGYEYKVEVISSLADSPEQMFDLVRKNMCDITFFTLFFIKMQNKKITNLLQTINTDSPRLTNYKHLNKTLTNIPMGIGPKDKPLYIPFGGGAYGFWANMKTVNSIDLPKSVNDLLDPKWKGKFSLNISQPYYNIVLCSLALGRNPFEINSLVLSGKRSEAVNFLNPNNPVMKTLVSLYSNSGNFWETVPEFKENLSIMTSWGPEMIKANEKGGKWKMLKLKEGNLVWLDTINFVKSLTGKKLEAAEIFANYLIGKKVQDRVVKDLSMVAVSTLVSSNPLLDSNPDFFNNNIFIPPFDKIADNIMIEMNKKALKEATAK